VNEDTDECSEVKCEAKTCASNNASERTEYGMNRNPSMLFEFDDVESFQQTEVDENLQPIDKLKVITGISSDFEEEVSHCVREATETYRLFEIESDYTRFVACYLTLHNYAITVRASGGGSGNPLQNLRHRFIICTESDPKSETPNHIVIDPQFKELFALAKPSHRYKRIYESIPAVFVGSMNALQQAVGILTKEVEQSFEEVLLSIPTWRTYDSIITKWLPKKWKDGDIRAQELKQWSRMVHQGFERYNKRQGEHIENRRNHKLSPGPQECLMECN